MHHKYFVDKHNNLIAYIFKYGLKVGDLHLTNFDDQQPYLANIVNTYLEKKYWCGW